MSNEIVKYSNQFNAQALRKFTALDLDLLMAIAARVRDKETGEVTFTFEELRQLAHVKKNLTDKELAGRIVEVNDRLLACRFRFQDDSRTVQFTLFSGFETDWKTAKLLVEVNPRFSFLLNDLTSQFTRFELAEFTALKSSYSKECYRRLKQYRQTGVWKVSIDEFRRLLDVPESYQARDLNKRVLKPIQDELGPLLNLVAHKKFQKKGSGRGGRSLVGFEFEFDPEKVPGGVSAPRVELSPGVVADAARKSLRDAARADERAEAERRREENLKAVAEERARRGGSMLMHAPDAARAVDVVLGYDEGVWNDEGNRQRLLDMLKAHAAELRAWASDAGVRLPSAESAGELREQVRDLPQEPQIQEQPGYGYQPGFQQPQQWQQQPWN